MHLKKKSSKTKVLADEAEEKPQKTEKSQQEEPDFKEAEEKSKEKAEETEDDQPQHTEEEATEEEEGAEKEHNPDEDDYLEAQLADVSDIDLVKPHFVQKDGFDYGEIMVGSSPDEAEIKTQIVMDAIDYLLPWRETSVGQSSEDMQLVEPFTMQEIAELMLVTGEDGEVLPEYSNLASYRRRLFVFGFLGEFGRAVVRGCRQAIQEKLNRDDGFAHKFLKVLKEIKMKIQKVVKNTLDRRMKGSRLFKKIKVCADKLQDRAQAMYSEYKRGSNEDRVELIPIKKENKREKLEDDYANEDGETEDSDDSEEGGE